MSNSKSIPSSLKKSPTETKGTWRFVVYSAIGIFAFFVPFTVGETNSILLDHLVNWLQSLLGSATKWVVYAIIAAGAFYPFVTGRFRKSGSRLFFAVLGLFGLIVATMLMFNFGPSIVFEERIGPFLYDKLVIPVGLLVPIGAIFLAFLVSFGLMEFVGVLVQKFMRPVFRTPGRSAIDAVASFVGSYSLGLLVTDGARSCNHCSGILNCISNLHGSYCSYARSNEPLGALLFHNLSGHFYCHSNHYPDSSTNQNS